MRERISIVAATGAVLGMLGLCCGLPVLLSAGFLGVLAGVSLGRWVLIVLGLATVAFAMWRRSERRRRSLCAAQHEKRDRGEHEDLGVHPREGF